MSSARSATRVGLLCVALTSALCAALVGCDQTHTTGAPDTPVYEASLSEGPLTLTAIVNDLDLTPVDDLTLTIHADTPPKQTVTIDDPAFDDAGWTVIERTDDPVEWLTTTRVRHQTRWTLRPYLPGAYTIPPVTASLTPTDPTEPTVSASTDAIEVTVRSLLPDDTDPELAARPEAFGDLREPVEEPTDLSETGRPAWASVLIACAAVLGVASIWLIARAARTRATEAAPNTEALITALRTAPPTDPAWLATGPRALAAALRPNERPPEGLAAIDLRRMAISAGNPDLAPLADELETARYRVPAGEHLSALHQRTLRALDTIRTPSTTPGTTPNTEPTAP